MKQLIEDKVISLIGYDQGIDEAQKQWQSDYMRWNPAKQFIWDALKLGDKFDLKSREGREYFRDMSLLLLRNLTDEQLVEFLALVAQRWSRQM